MAGSSLVRHLQGKLCGAACNGSFRQCLGVCSPAGSAVPPSQSSSGCVWFQAPGSVWKWRWGYVEAAPGRAGLASSRSVPRVLRWASPRPSGGLVRFAERCAGWALQGVSGEGEASTSTLPFCSECCWVLGFFLFVSVPAWKFMLPYRRSFETRKQTPGTLLPRPLPRCKPRCWQCRPVLQSFADTPCFFFVP